MVKKYGQMVLSMKETTKREEEMAREKLSSQIHQFLKVSSRMTSFMDSVFIFGLTEENIKDIGVKTKCTDKVRLNGQMVEFMKVSTRKT